MTAPRRRIVRPAPAEPTPDPQRQRRAQRLRAKLDQERAGLARWLGRLRRAFHAFEKSQAAVARLERQLTQLEE
jgi:hypothetical protein